MKFLRIETEPAIFGICIFAIIDDQTGGGSIAIGFSPIWREFRGLPHSTFFPQGALEISSID